MVRVPAIMAHREEEAAPLLNTGAESANAGRLADPKPKASPPPLSPAIPPASAAVVNFDEKGSAKWAAAEGVPVAQGSVIGEPLLREQWDSGLLSCLGRNDEFCSSDLEVYDTPCFLLKN